MLKLREIYPDLGSREQQVADFVCDHLDSYGSGGSVPIASYLRCRLRKTGIRSSVYANADPQQLSLIRMEKKDAIAVISWTGVSRELVHVVEKAKNLKAGTIAITDFPNSPLGRTADIVIQNTGTHFCGNGNKTYSRLAQLAAVDFLYIAIFRNIGWKQISARETL
jgi:DNA-binding MurR/RpiR family transcriptional regulator